MRDVVRDPKRAFRCPRCGEPVVYKGRGRRPIWCSATCRVEASVERRGNRLVGVQPEVVKIVPPTQRLSEWEQGRRRQIEEALTEEAALRAVADSEYLVLKLLEQLRSSIPDETNSRRRRIAIALEAATEAYAPPSDSRSDSAPVVAPHRPWKRSAEEWASLLEELGAQFAAGQFYSRDLPTIDASLGRVVDRYMQRLRERR